MSIIFPIFFVLFLALVIWKMVKKDYTSPVIPPNPPSVEPEPVDPDPVEPVEPDPVEPDPVEPDPHAPDHPC